MLLILLFISLHLDPVLQFVFVNLYPDKSYKFLLSYYYYK